MSGDVDSRGLLVNAEPGFADGLAAQIGEGIQIAERYQSSALHQPEGAQLRTRLSELLDQRKEIEPQFFRFVTISDVAALDAGVDIGGILDAIPPAGATVIHAATPGLEYVVDMLPEDGDTVRPIMLHILGLLDGIYARSNDSPLPHQIPNGTCDWRAHANSRRNRWKATDMRVLSMTKGNRIFVWIVCPDCVRKLQRKHQHGLLLTPPAATQ